MTSIKTDGKGQLSLDLALAILLVLIILSSVLSYSGTLQGSIEPGRTLMGLNTVADYTVGVLTTFYNSMLLLQPAGGQGASYSMTFPAAYSAESENRYNIGYRASFLASSYLKVADAHNPAVFAERKLGFRIVCTEDKITPASAGNRLNLTNCKLSRNDLSCARCQLT